MQAAAQVRATARKTTVFMTSSFVLVWAAPHGVRARANQSDQRGRSVREGEEACDGRRANVVTRCGRRGRDDPSGGDRENIGRRRRDDLRRGAAVRAGAALRRLVL